MSLSHFEAWSKLGPEKRARRFFATGPILIVLSLLFVLLSGCSTYRIENISLSLPTVKSAIVKRLPQGLRKESLNGRHLFSGYFTPGNYFQNATELKERAYAEVVISGSSRPYDIEVKVYREEKDPGTGRFSGPVKDDKLAEELGQILRDALADRREDRNIIDDFRAF